MTQPFLSVIIPAYNEAGRIKKTLDAIRAYKDSKEFLTEIIVVDDGSRDATPTILESSLTLLPQLIVLRNERNRGKGYSVRRGALASRGQYILFTDADLSTPIREADRLLDLIESSHADAVVGSRALNRKLTGIRQPWFREYGGRFFNLIVRLSTDLKIHDTQCGFKLFKRERTQRAFKLLTIDGFGFDPELLFLIRLCGGQILETPVRWNNDPASRVHFLRDSTRMAAQMALLRWRIWTRYYRRLERRRNAPPAC